MSNGYQKNEKSLIESTKRRSETMRINACDVDAAVLADQQRRPISSGWIRHTWSDVLQVKFNSIGA